MTAWNLVTFLVTQSYLFTERHYDRDETDAEAQPHKHKLVYYQTRVPHATIIPVNKQNYMHLTADPITSKCLSSPSHFKGRVQALLKTLQFSRRLFMQFG